MADSQESFSKIKGLLESHGELLVDLPTFWPVEGGVGRITNYFGPEVHPFTNQWYLHKGIDLAYRRGKEVVSAANGKVVERKYDPKGFGNYIVIRHAYGFATKYAHLDNVYVEEGDVVTQGQKVGTMGNTGWSTGPHLHFEVRIGSQVVDPERFLNVSSNLK
jgi:murein DD-endopeptidase MepM/ murein hydrolase activator NlpD